MNQPLKCPSVKIRHETEGDALKAIRDASFRGAPELNAYKCILCNFGWHLTSTSTKRTKKK